MPYNRFFLEVIFEKNAQVILSGDEAHHAIHVVRKKKGEPVELINGKNQLALGEILSIDKREIHLKIREIKHESSPPYTLVLCQALCRLNRLETIVEKVTELGVTEIWLFPGELSEKKEISSNQMGRLQHIAISAIKQSGRLDLPLIQCKPPLMLWPQEEGELYFGAIDREAPMLISQEVKEKRVLFFVGPESGFTKNECTQLTLLKALGVTLHKNILRVDTAAIVGIAFMGTHFVKKI